MKKLFGYRLLGQLLQGLADACYRDDWRTERERDGYDDDREGRYGERDGRGYGGGRGRY